MKKGERMKKIKYLLVLVLTLTLLTGCSLGKKEEAEGKEKLMSCTRTLTEEDTNYDLTYNVTYKGDYVIKVESIEKITSTDEEFLENYKTTIENIIAPYKKVDHYDNEVTIENGTLTSKTTIDYSKINKDELVKVNSSIESLYTEDGKVELSTIKSIYNTAGATCTDKE